MQYRKNLIALGLILILAALMLNSGETPPERDLQTKPVAVKPYITPKPPTREEEYFPKCPGPDDGVVIRLENKKRTELR